jgi:hypothetical protein
MMSRPIPEDIIEKIIYYLWDDDDALLQCSSISRSFHTASHKHLFQSLQVVLDEDALYNNIPPIRPLLQSLLIHIDIGATEYVDEDSAIVDILNNIADLAILRGLTLTSLAGESKDWTLIPPSLKTSLIKFIQSPSVRTVTIDAIDTHSFPMDVFNEARALRHLCFVNTQLSPFSSYRPIDQSPEGLPARETGKIYLESIETASEYIPNLVAYISRDECPLSFSNLRELRIEGSVDPEGACSLLSLAAESLEAFTWMDFFGESYS